MFKSVNPIWQKLFDDLVIVARKQMRDLPPRMKDEEDIAISAIKSYFRCVEKGKFELQEDGFGLLPRLSLIAIRKCADLAAYLKAQKRDVARVTDAEIDEIVGRDASPSSIVEQEEGRQRLLEALPDDRLRQMARWKMEGYKNKEIAEELGCVERSVERGIGTIRKAWKEFVKKSWEDSVGS